MAWSHYQYLLLLAACLALTVPLEPLFGVRVWRAWSRVVRALALPVVVFCAWDIWAIHHRDWAYNPRYVTGWDLPGHLPVEELLFFVVVPMCAVMTYEVVRRRV